MNNKKVVAFVEPSFYGVGFVRAASDLGHKIISIVSSKNNPKEYGYEGLYDDIIIADVRDEESIFNAIKNSKYYGKLDALIPAADYVSAITAKVDERLGLTGIPYEAEVKSRNKDLAREAYKENGVPSAKFKKVKNYVESKKAVDEIGYPVILKPTNCESSQNVFFINNNLELENAVECMSNFKESYMGFKVRKEFLIEEYLEGQEFSIEVFLHNGKKVFSSVTEKIVSKLPYFVETAHIVPTSVYLDKQNDIIDVAIMAVKALGIMNGPCHVEVKLSKTGPRLIEVNGRPGGDNISSDLLINALGIDLFKATINYYLDDVISLTPSQHKAAAVAYLIAKKDGILSKVNGLDDLKNNKNVIRYNMDLKSGDAIRTAQNSDERLGYIIVKADVPKEAKKMALDLINKLEIVYMKN